MNPTGHGSRSPSRFRWPRIALPRICAGLTALLGAAVLCGWALDIALLKSVLPGAVQMKANTAVGLILSGAALFILANIQSAPWQYAGQALALAVAALGLVTCGEYVFAWDAGIDELLFRDTGTAYNLIRGRMSPYSAAAFAGIGYALAALPLRGSRLKVCIAAAGVATIGTVSFLGYLWNASELVTDTVLPPVAVHTAVAFMLLGAGTLLAKPRAPTLRAGPRFTRVEATILTGFVGAFFLLMLGGGYTYRASVQYAQAMERVARAEHVRAGLHRLYATLTDAGIAQRNYLITGNVENRKLFAQRNAEAARQQQLLEQLVVDDPEQAQNLAELRPLLAAREKILGDTIVVFEQDGFDAAKERVTLGLAGPPMRAIRLLLERIEGVEARVLDKSQAHSTDVRRLTLLSLLLTLTIATSVFLVLFYGIRRETLARQEAESLDATYRRVLLLFATSASREHSLRGLLEMLAADHAYVACSFHRMDPSSGRLVREAKYGTSTAIPEECGSEEGYLGRAAASHATVETVLATDAQDGEMRAHVEPLYVLAAPATYRGQCFGVLTVASRKAFSVRARAFVGQMGAQLGVALDNAQQYDDARLLADLLQQGNREISQKNSELERASRLKSDFLATMSHELRTPLNAIIGFADVLRDGLLGELSAPQSEHVGDILDAGEHLLALINDILDLSKVEAGRMDLDLEPMELRPLLQNALSMVKEKALAQGLRLALVTDDDLPLLTADPRKLKQILYNLLANAVKFTGEGGTVTLTARRTDGPEGDRLELSVADTGLGISEADQERLFQPFVQVDSSIARNYGGTGLGLAMVRRLAELHGGQVTVASEPGKGSTFTVWLPYRSAGAPSTAAPAREDERFPTHSGTVLVVDDDEMTVEIVSAFLDGAGFNVIRAYDGREGVEQAQRLRPDLVILDLMMPEISGFEVVDALKADASMRTIPIIALTSKALTAEEERSLHGRVVRVLQKSDFDNGLIAEVRRTLAGPLPATPPEMILEGSLT